MHPGFEAAARDNLAAIARNPYPGRFIVAGRTLSDELFLAYAIMGRSTNSRNRMFVAEDVHVRTEAVDPAKLEDPSLIIYHPLRTEGSVQILTNGDQTDTIWQEYKHRRLLSSTGAEPGTDARRSLMAASFLQALSTRTFEPDAPHFTPRISCMADASDPRGGYGFSILKACGQMDGLPQRNFFLYETGIHGYGHAIHTYMGDGNPLPTFAGEPVAVPVEGDLDKASDMFWDLLNADNRISLLVRICDRDGQYRQRIRNRYS